MKKRFEDKKPVIISNFREMPPMSMSLSTMRWNFTGSWRYLRPYYDHKVSPCHAGCPGGQNVEGWIRLMEEGHYEEAIRLLREENPFPSITGRVCFHPCELKCSRAYFDKSVAINNLERFLADHTNPDYKIKKEEIAGSTGKKVAIVGSGPAGLSCAYHLLRLGYEVEVFEAEDAPGGVLRIGIPEYRLPKNILSREIKILTSAGVKIHTRKRVGKDISYDSLKNYFAVFLATGVHKSRRLGIPNEEAEGVMSGLEYLKKVNLKERIFTGKKVIVVGGGNTAMDSARVARRSGADVKIIYRRTRAEMPAWEEEIEEAINEGISILELTIPKKVLVKDSKVVGIQVQRAKLGEPDSSGRRKPEPIEGSEYDIECDMILSAIGEEIDEDALPEIKISKGNVHVSKDLSTSLKNYFAGGDIIDQPHTVIDAIASGKKAAIAIDCRYRKLDFEEVLKEISVGEWGAISMLVYREKYVFKNFVSPTVRLSKETVDPKSINTAYFQPSDRSQMNKISLSERSNSFLEVNLGLTQPQAMNDLLRCFHCGRCTMCDNCYIFCPDNAISHKKNGFGYDIDLDYCKGCGICVTECPRNAMGMEKESKI
ncbi:MAG: NAD(P)-binding protein [Deltaproteobacteria bacterium]|nr:NAD(P)-binding protein [Deltaproteobacteria bacterium]